MPDISLLGRIRLAGIDDVCGAKSFVMIGLVFEQDRVMTIDLLTLPPARASVTHAAAFDSRRARVGGVPDYQPWLGIGLVFDRYRML